MKAMKDTIRIPHNNPFKVIKEPGYYLLKIVLKGGQYFDVICRVHSDRPFLDMMAWDTLHNTVLYKNLFVNKIHMLTRGSTPDWTISAVSKLEVDNETTYEDEQIRAHAEPLGDLKKPGYYIITIAHSFSDTAPLSVCEEILVYVYNEDPFLDIKGWHPINTTTLVRESYEKIYKNQVPRLYNNRNIKGVLIIKELIPSVMVEGTV